MKPELHAAIVGGGSASSSKGQSANANTIRFHLTTAGRNGTQQGDYIGDYSIEVRRRCRLFDRPLLQTIKMDCSSRNRDRVATTLPTDPNHPGLVDPTSLPFESKPKQSFWPRKQR